MTRRHDAVPGPLRASGVATLLSSRVPGEIAQRWRPPVHRREFWAVQLLVLAIAAGHGLLELSDHRLHGAASLIPTSFFIIPVVYAALNFGLAGSLPTALWCALLSIPNILGLHAGPERLGEAWQIGTVVALAAFIGVRVDHEKHARMDAERRERERQVSEDKYRGVFDQVVEPILLLDGSGVIQDVNRAALGLFAAEDGQLVGRHAAGLVGSDLTDLSDSGSAREVRPIYVAGRPGPAWVEPVVIPFVDPGGSPRIQLVLRDVTSRHVRQQELEAYTRQTIAAREAERGRIARELHDGPVQSLVLLWRKLDELGSLSGDEQQPLLMAAQREAQLIADELRRFSRDLRPSILDDLGLKPALKAETANFGGRTGTSARFVCSGTERRLPPERELMFLRIAQEALRNVEQHAAARSAVVRLRYQADGVQLIISDDGTGLAQMPATRYLLAEGKLGLIGMQERVRLVGGTFAVHARPAGGTSVEVRAPG